MILVNLWNFNIFAESSSQLRGADLAGDIEEEEEKEDEGKEGVELVQMLKTNKKSHEISTIELSAVKTSAFWTICDIGRL